MIKNELKIRGFKFVITLLLKSKKKTENENETRYGTFNLNSVIETIIHDADIDNVFYIVRL